MQGNKLFSMDKLTKSQQWHLLQVYTDHCSHILGNTILLGPGYTYTCQWHHQQMFFNFFIRPPGMVVPGSLMFDCWCFLYLLPIAVKLCHMIGSMFNFIIQVPKFGVLPPKLGPNMCKIQRDFGQLQTLIVNISETDGCIWNPKDMWSTTIPPTFGKKNPVNFGPLITVVETPKLTFSENHHFGH